MGTSLKYLHVFVLLSAFASTLACGEITQQYWESTTEVALRHSLEPELLAALVWQESRYCDDRVSSAGAIGLGQLMPTTAQELGVDPWQSAENLEGAARYLKIQLDTFGTLELALAAYNAGPGSVRRHKGLPPYGETQAYVPAVLAYYEDFKERSGKVKLPQLVALTEIAENNGAALIYQRGEQTAEAEDSPLIYSRAEQDAQSGADTEPGSGFVIYRRDE